MKLGEIKIEALKLMNADYKNNYTISGLSTLLEDDNYGKYLRAMNGSINRCFDRIKSLGKQPKRLLVIDKGVSEEDLLFLDLTAPLYTPVDVIERITYYEADTGYYEGDMPFQKEIDTLILPNKIGVYKMIYLAKLPYITTQEDTADLDMPEELARLVPYFIKGDLYEEDEPDLAIKARNIFESSLATLYKEPESRQKKVVDVYYGI